MLSLCHNLSHVEVAIGLATRVIEAYGGEAPWRAARSVEAVVSAAGWAFRLK